MLSVCFTSGFFDASQLSVPPNCPGVRLKISGSSCMRSQPAGLFSNSQEAGSSESFVPIEFGTL